MTPEIAKKLQDYLDYIRKKDWTSLLYHFGWDECRAVYDMFKDLGISIKLTGPNDPRAVTCMFRKMVAYSTLAGMNDVDVKISRYGIKIKHKGAVLTVGYNPAGNNAWVFSLEDGSNKELTEAGVGYNKLVDAIIGNNVVLFINQRPSDYYL